LGSTASTELYQAGVDAAQGIVDGLQAQEEKIAKQMERIAKKMVDAIKRELGIASPSKVFAEIGKFSTEGLAKGLEAYSSVVEKSAENVGQSAIKALSKTISGMSELIQADVNLNPTITPVLDLTGVKKEAKTISNMLRSAPVAVGTSYSSAMSASAGYAANKASGAMDANVEIVDESVHFTQNNLSPKALSEIEIYRQTKNQLSRAKGALKP
jgi:hypothetical protein